jgi:hypothetical protein
MARLTYVFRSDTTNFITTAIGLLIFIVQGVPYVQHHKEKKIKKAKQKLLFTELAQYVHHYSQYTNLAILPSQQTHI